MRRIKKLKANQDEQIDSRCFPASVAVIGNSQANAVDHMILAIQTILANCQDSWRRRCALKPAQSQTYRDTIGRNVSFLPFTNVTVAKPLLLLLKPQPVLLLLDAARNRAILAKAESTLSRNSLASCHALTSTCSSYAHECRRYGRPSSHADARL